MASQVVNSRSKAFLFKFTEIRKTVETGASRPHRPIQGEHI